jgi:peptidyl-dipeptidase Dcp
MDRGDAAQLRYFILKPRYRGIGLGNKLMNLYMEHLKQCNYKASYLWTTDELPASAHLYQKFGFKLTEEKPSAEFGKRVTEQRYDLIVEPPGK